MDFLPTLMPVKHNTLDPVGVYYPCNTIMPTLTYKVTEEEAAAIRQEAREQRRSLSAYLRAATIPKEKPFVGQYIPARHPISGFWHNAAPNQPQYTLEELKSFLEDFP